MGRQMSRPWLMVALSALLVFSGTPAVLARDAASHRVTQPVRTSDAHPADPNLDPADGVSGSIWSDATLPDEPTLVGRSAYRQSVLNPDGTYTDTISTRPVFWQDKTTNEWKDFTNQILPATPDTVVAGFAQESTGNGYQVRFGTADKLTRGERGFQLAAGEASVEIVPIGAAPRDVSVTEREVVYHDAYPGVDLRYTLDNERVKEDIILSQVPKNDAQATFVYDLLLNGLIATQLDDGSIAFVDASNTPVFTIPRPFMLDSNGADALAKSYSPAVSMTLTQSSDGKARLELAADLSWLQDPARVYPVIIDPTVINWTVQPDDANAQDVTIDETSPTTNFYAATTLNEGKNGSGKRAELLLQFPSLGEMPQDSTIVSATLELDTTTTATLFNTEVHDTTTAWDQTNVTWNTKPGIGSDIWATNASITGTLWSWDITKLVGNWVSGQLENKGLRILAVGDTGRAATYFSSFSTNTKRPRIQLTYIGPNRLGLSKRWGYGALHSYGGGNTSMVNVSTGNLVFQHHGGLIQTQGFGIDLTHTYNSQDPSGQGSWYGEGWSFAMDLRLVELGNGNAVVLRDGSGGTSRRYAKDSITSGTQNYNSALLGTKLEKDVQPSPPDPNRIYKLVQDHGLTALYFDATGKLTRMEDLNGNYLTFSYDGSDRLTTITDIFGRTSTLVYNGTGGRLSQITDMAGRVSTYGYDSKGNLTTIKHAFGTPDVVTTTLAYDDMSQLITVIDPRGHASPIRYSYLHTWDTAANKEGWSTGSPTKVTLNQSTTRAHNGSGSLKASLTNVTDWVYVNRNQASAQVLSSIPEELVLWVYRPSGTAAVDVRLSLVYDFGHTIVVKDGPIISLTAGTWNAVRFRDAVLHPGMPVSDVRLYIRAGGGGFSGDLFLDDLSVRGTTHEVYDAYSVKVNTLTYSWPNPTLNLSGSTQVAELNTSGGWSTTTYTYNRAGQVTEVIDPLNNTSTQTFDSNGLLKTSRLPGSLSDTLTYDYVSGRTEWQQMANELAEITRRGVDTTSGDTRFILDPTNEVLERTGGGVFYATVYGRDTHGNITQVATKKYAAGTNLDQWPLPNALATEHQTDYTYTTGGQLASMTDANGRTTTYGYDSYGYLNQITAPRGAGEATDRVTTFVNNLDGTPSQMVDPRGQTTTYQYDGLGRLKQINYGVVNGTPAFSVSYTYDANGNRTAMSDAAGSSSWSYDNNNRVTSESRTQNGITKTAQYGYYNSGHPHTITTFANQTVTFGYDIALRVTSQTDPKDGNRAITFAYNTRSLRTRITFGSGAYQETTYDKADRIDLLTLKTSAGTTLQRFDYDYGIDVNGVRSIVYRSGKLASVTELDGSVVSYSYDAFDHLVGATRTGTNPFTQSYAYDGTDNRTSYTAGTTKTATFDWANQMNTFGDDAYSYDRDGNLTAIDLGNNGSADSSFSYDASNKWTSGTLNGVSVSFTYDGLGRRASRTVNGSRTDYWYDLTGLTLETGATSATYLRDMSGCLLSVYSGNTLYNYARDRLGTVTGLVTTSGNLAGVYRYDPWGNAIGTPPTAYNPFRFTSTYLDASTGIYQMGARYYPPTTDRFTQLDPLPSSIFTPNRYTYVHGNPTNRVDPSGMSDGGSGGSCGCDTIPEIYWIIWLYFAVGEPLYGDWGDLPEEGSGLECAKDRVDCWYTQTSVDENGQFWAITVCQDRYTGRTCLRAMDIFE